MPLGKQLVPFSTVHERHIQVPSGMGGHVIVVRAVARKKSHCYRHIYQAAEESTVRPRPVLHWVKKHVQFTARWAEADNLYPQQTPEGMKIPGLSLKQTLFPIRV
jgi:hypothetical protein